ncbi:E3 SUMO-protein ligase PIAS4b [Trichomycterus rosablanca]|uniref:E3 SUMO-protein ligase PIAS4b n=1 Tax=Trichomycterus rosablanca TaxID=2290929 RepID=UPI002F35EDAB
MSTELLEATIMVERLRVAELRSLLSTMGKDKKGLKKELVQRATDLLHKELHPELLSTIRELYNRRHSTGNDSSRRSQVITIPIASDVSVKHPRKSDPSAQRPVYKPERQMIKLPFYQTLETVIAPVSLVPLSANILQTSYVSFSLTSRQWSQIKNCQEIRAGVKSVQVVLRICYTESIGVEDDQYPTKISVLVNGMDCPVQTRYSSNKKGLEPSRPCCPINLTSLVNQLADNYVSIIWENFGKHYSAAIYLVRVFSSSELLEQLKKSGAESVECCRQRICEKLHCNTENEITTTGLQVSLICPLAKMRMSTPCRAQTCAHLQCFDATFYLQMNETRPRWTCPVCHKPALFEALRIDSLLSGIIQCAEEAVQEIEYLSNGSWKAVRKEECSKTLDHVPPGHKNNAVVLDIVDLTECSSDDDDDGVHREEIVLTHVRTERVCFTKGGKYMK